MPYLGISMDILEKYPPQQLSPLVLAYVGDAVYEVYIRSYLLSREILKVNMLHKEAIQYVRARAQALALEKLMDGLTEAETSIVRRGRNAKSMHCPKHADPADYQKATAFEAFLGYLYLTKNETRLRKILQETVKIIESGIGDNGKDKTSC